MHNTDLMNTNLASARLSIVALYELKGGKREGDSGGDALGEEEDEMGIAFQPSVV